ncbi:ribosomal protein S18-alanine N-acetyltransferase [Chitinilyticum litopenaei]|uniref:ribosomal protein S18-alanine N-acetyltransferase n=1 Tax=Chitinilyticum litopenaei TaxID=1121276 RepID=UPI0003FD909B|nr:ribosomal protein S18-alanine N-acetyltransferase [Chitinilyticum litopenaei]
MMDQGICRLASNDLAELQALDAATNAHPWSTAGWQSSLAGDLCLGWRASGQLQGFAVCQLLAGEAELLLIAVTPEHQRQGIASKLFQALGSELDTRQVERIFLEVRASNAPARACYERHGFRECGRRKNYYPAAAGREDAILYALERRASEEPQ